MWKTVMINMTILLIGFVGPYFASHLVRASSWYYYYWPTTLNQPNAVLDYLTLVQ